MTSYSYSAETQFLDITDPDFVEVTVRRDRGVLWINIDGKCAIRICQIKKLVGTIPRPKLPNLDR